MNAVATDVSAPTKSIAIVHSDSLWASMIERTLHAVFPACCTFCHNGGESALLELVARSWDLVIMHLSTSDLDGLDYIPAVLCRSRIRCSIVVTDRVDEHACWILRRLPLAAICDARYHTIGLFTQVVHALTKGGRYLSENIARAMGSWHARSVHAILSPREQLVLSVLAEGVDNAEAAQLLQLSPDTVRSHRCHIMSKLNLHHKGALVKFAESHGFVRYASPRVLHPGFDLALRTMQQGHKLQ